MSISTPPTAARQPKTRQTRRHHERSLKVLISPSLGQPGTFVRITQDGVAAHYWIFPKDDGSFSVEKPGIEGDDVYTVKPADARGCTCPGFASHNYCKHFDAIRALLAAGKLKASEPPHGTGCACDDCQRLSQAAPASANHGIPF